MRFYVESAVRKQRTRTLRRSAPVRHRFKQFICGGAIRLVRNRAVTIDGEENILAHKEELKQLQDAGVIEIHVGGVNGPLYQFDGELLEEEPKVLEEARNDAQEDSEEAADAPEEEVEDSEAAPLEEPPPAEEEVKEEPAPAPSEPAPRSKKRGKKGKKR